MLIPLENMYCGIFDSNIARKNYTESKNRTVPCYEIELFHGNGGISYIDGSSYPVKKGMLIVAKPGQIRHSIFPVRCSFIRFYPRKDIDSEIERSLLSLPDCTYVSDSDVLDGMFALLTRLGTCFGTEHSEEINVIKANALFLDMVYRCMRLNKGILESSSTSHKSYIAQQAYEYINENFTDDCSLGVLAEVLSVSPNHLHTVFTKSMGITPYKYVLKKRVEKAQKLIMAGEKSMLEISLETGFCSQSHFNKIFREYTGQTPANYRKNLLDHY